MTKYRITTKYPVYVNGGCIPYTGYYVQKLKGGFFRDKWVDIKGFIDKEKAEKLLEALEA